MGAVLGVLLRNYGFTDLPPTLPLPRSDPVTRISESSYRRVRTMMLDGRDHDPSHGSTVICMELEAPRTAGDREGTANTQHR